MSIFLLINNLAFKSKESGNNYVDYLYSPVSGLWHCQKYQQRTQFLDKLHTIVNDINTNIENTNKLSDSQINQHPGALFK